MSTLSPDFPTATTTTNIVPFNGWPSNLRLRNGTAELIITLDVGPRILSYTNRQGFNPLKIFEDQAGTAKESVWRSRGGHRLWIAPEDKEKTYFPDNGRVAWEQFGEFHVKLKPPLERSNGIQKELEITLDSTGAGVTVLHRVICIGPSPVELSPWAITVMAAGGTAIIPHQAMGQHPRDLLPNRSLVLWPYTDMTDARWRFGRKFILLKQESTGVPTKIGLPHPLGWSGYFVGGVFFLKRYPWNPSATYPDFGCNVEMFSNARMLELESLGPLTRLSPQESVEHIERWELHDVPSSVDLNSEESIAAFVEPLVASGHPK